MRRLALLLPAWLALTVGEYSLTHECPAHSAPSSIAQVATHEHAGHGDATTQPGDSGHGDHACMCVGTCATAVGASLAAAPSAPTAAIVDVVSSTAPHSVDASVAGSQLLLPFPNGPPSNL